MTGREALVRAAADLTDAGVPNAMGDARRLLAHALGIEAGQLTLVLPDRLTQAQLSDLNGLLAQRRNRRPVSQILGHRMFFGRCFEVTSDVLDPRPETETLVARALTLPWRTVLDLGTGSGCILLSLLAERPEAVGTGVDLSGSALEIARRNRNGLRIAERAGFLQSDWFDKIDAKFDLVVSNPPYIDNADYLGLSPDVLDWEPEMALRAGTEGLEAYRSIVSEAPRYLVNEGRLLLETGLGQAPEVARLLSGAGFSDITVHPDLDGRDRVVEGEWQS